LSPVEANRAFFYPINPFLPIALQEDVLSVVIASGNALQPVPSSHLDFILILHLIMDVLEMTELPTGRKPD